MNDLTKYQRECLASWYDISRNATAGWYPGEFSERKPTLDKLHRLGIVERPHPALSGWQAKVTDYGLEVAARCAAEFAPR